MRRPNFRGWVSRELKYLSGEDTLNLRRLAFLAQGSQPRLRERLVLYALVTGQTKRLESYLHNETLRSEFAIAEQTLKDIDFDHPDRQILTHLPQRYRKTFDSFLAAYHLIDSRNDSKLLRWEKTIRLQQEKGVSNADVYRDLNLNAGNINAYLKHGDIDRVTLTTATEIMKYLIAL